MKKIIWITGISGTGKTTFAKYFLKKKTNFIWLDGDNFRKLFKNDLGYTLKDRNTNAERLINFVSFLNKNGLNIIISANLTSEKYKKIIKKKFKNLIHVHIEADIKILRKRDNKNIYKKNVKNVVGQDIIIKRNSNICDYKINNNASKKDFLKKVKLFIKRRK